MRGFDLRAQMVVFDTWHQDARNIGCHYLGIPLVTLPVLGGLAMVKLGLSLPFLDEVDLALVLLALTFLFDLVVEWRLAPPVLALGLILWWVSTLLTPAGLGGVFVLGWVFQLVGHRVLEKNAPAFTDNLIHLIVGPRWLVNKWFGLIKPEGEP